MSTLTWHPVTAGDIAAVAALAERCIEADGGLPLIAGESFLAGRFAAPGAVTRCAVDGAGRPVAAGAVRAQQTGEVRRAAYLGLVDPAHRGRGIGAALLDWGLAAARAVAAEVVVESESLTDAAAALFAERGLARTFAEDVLRFDLRDGAPPTVPLPSGIRLSTWSPGRAGRFFAVYQAAFRERPGFPGWPQQRWVDWTTGDDEFRWEWSLLATADGADVGFITCGGGWIVQVGVDPGWRGRRLGAALVAEALRRMRVDGAVEALLDVNVDNPAGEFYRRLGFVALGRRARFAPVG